MRVQVHEHNCVTSPEGSLAVNRALRNKTWNYNFGIYPAAHTSDLPYWFYRGANEGSAANIIAPNIAVSFDDGYDEAWLNLIADRHATLSGLIRHDWRSQRHVQPEHQLAIVRFS